MTEKEMTLRLIDATSEMFAILGEIEIKLSPGIDDAKINTAYRKVAEARYEVFSLILKAEDETKGQQT